MGGRVSEWDGLKQIVPRFKGWASKRVLALRLAYVLHCTVLGIAWAIDSHDIGTYYE